MFLLQYRKNAGLLKASQAMYLLIKMMTNVTENSKRLQLVSSNVFLQVVRKAITIPFSYQRMHDPVLMTVTCLLHICEN